MSKTGSDTTNIDKQAQLQAIQEHNGEVKTDIDSIGEKLKNYCSQIYRDTSNDVSVAEHKKHEINEVQPIILPTQVEKAVNELKNKKQGKIPAESAKTIHKNGSITVCSY